VLLHKIGDTIVIAGAQLG